MADRETDRFLSALYEQARQDGEDPEAVAERIWQNARGVSRRELLGGAGALAAGTAIGAGGAFGATQRASAQASTSDGDGNVGTPNDEVDVFADSVDAKISNTTVNASDDDFADINEALSFANNNGFSRVYAPAGEGSGANGEYVVTAGSGSSGATVPNSVTVFGDGPESTVIKLDDSQASDYNFVVRPNTLATVHDLAINGNAANQTDGGDETLQAGIGSPRNSQQDGITINNVRVFNTQYRGAFLSGVPNLHVTNLEAENCGNRGIHIEDATGSAPSTGVTAHGLRSSGTNSRSAGTNDEGGVVIGDQIDDSVITGMVSENDVGSGIWVENVDNTVLSGVSLGAGEEGVLLVNCAGISGTLNSFDAGTDGIRIANNVLGTLQVYSRGAAAEGLHITGNIGDVQANVETAGDHGALLEGVGRGKLSIVATSNDQNANGTASLEATADSNGNNSRRLHIEVSNVANGSGIILDSNTANIRVEGFDDNGVQTETGTGNDVADVLS